MQARHIARETATLRRLREKRKSEDPPDEDRDIMLFVFSDRVAGG
jgi:hypothetical protein